MLTTITINSKEILCEGLKFLSNTYRAYTTLNVSKKKLSLQINDDKPLILNIFDKKDYIYYNHETGVAVGFLEKEIKIAKIINNQKVLEATIDYNNCIENYTTTSPTIESIIKDLK
jgi:hypothetical protein